MGRKCIRRRCVEFRRRYVDRLGRLSAQSGNARDRANVEGRRKPHMAGYGRGPSGVDRAMGYAASPDQAVNRTFGRIA